MVGRSPELLPAGNGDDAISSCNHCPVIAAPSVTIQCGVDYPLAPRRAASVMRDLPSMRYSTRNEVIARVVTLLLATASACLGLFVLSCLVNVHYGPRYYHQWTFELAEGAVHLNRFGRRPSDAELADPRLRFEFPARLQGWKGGWSPSSPRTHLPSVEVHQTGQIYIKITLLIFACISVGLLLPLLVLRQRLRAKMALPRCHGCGYDLSPTMSTCPECGHVIATQE